MVEGKALGSSPAMGGKRESLMSTVSPVLTLYKIVTKINVLTSQRSLFCVCVSFYRFGLFMFAFF